MMTMRFSLCRIGVAAAFAVASCGGALLRPVGAQVPSPAPPPKVLFKMTEAHRALKSFSGVITITSGDNDTTEITLAFRRPDRLRAVLTNKKKAERVGAPRTVYVDGKNVYVLQSNKWSRRGPFKPGDDLFRAYAELMPQTWASDLFYRSIAWNEPNAINATYRSENGVQDGVPVTITRMSYTNDQASIDYDVSYAIGKNDGLLREWRWNASANSPMHSEDDGSIAVRYTKVRANPVLPDRLFMPPADAIKKTQKSARPALRRK